MVYSCTWCLCARTPPIAAANRWRRAVRTLSPLPLPLPDRCLLSRRVPHCPDTCIPPTPKPHQACKRGDDDAAAQALAAGADPNALDAAGRAPLALAAASRGGAAGTSADKETSTSSEGLVRRLIAAGARVRAASPADLATALHAACGAADAPAARVLLEHGASAAAADGRRRTPLHALVEEQGDGSNGGGSGGSSSSGLGLVLGATGDAAARAAALRRADAVDAIAAALLAAGADSSAVDAAGRTPLAAALAAGDAAAAFALWRLAGGAGEGGAGEGAPAGAAAAGAGGVGALPPAAAAALLDLLRCELDEADLSLAPAAAREAARAAELATVLPGLRRLLLDGGLRLRRAQSGGGSSCGGGGGGGSGAIDSEAAAAAVAAVAPS